jgi:hypothetical protein
VLLTKHHTIRRIGEWRCSSTHSLTLALGGGEWSASHPGRFTPRESPWYPLDRRLGGPQSCVLKNVNSQERLRPMELVVIYDK